MTITMKFNTPTLFVDDLEPLISSACVMYENIPFTKSSGENGATIFELWSQEKNQGEGTPPLVALTFNPPPSAQVEITTPRVNNTTADLIATHFSKTLSTLGFQEITEPAIGATQRTPTQSTNTTENSMTNPSTFEIRLAEEANLVTLLQGWCALNEGYHVTKDVHGQSGDITYGIAPDDAEFGTPLLAKLTLKKQQTAFPKQLGEMLEHDNGNVLGVTMVVNHENADYRDKVALDLALQFRNNGAMGLENVVPTKHQKHITPPANSFASMAGNKSIQYEFPADNVSKADKALESLIEALQEQGFSFNFGNINGNAHQLYTFYRQGDDRKPVATIEFDALADKPTIEIDANVPAQKKIIAALAKPLFEAAGGKEVRGAVVGM